MSNPSSTLNLSRRVALGTGLVAGAAVAAKPARADDHTPIIFTDAEAPWAPLKVTDVDRLPWQSVGGRYERKFLFGDENSESKLRIIQCRPGWYANPTHYHHYHEWAYITSGDLTDNEFIDPRQKVGSLMQYREGFWLDRPPFGLHGSDPGRLPSQAGGTALLMAEGRVSGTTIPTRPNYTDEWKSVEEWTKPRILDTIGEMEWEDDPEVNGLKVKYLSHDDTQGFAARLNWLPAGWTADQDPEFARTWYYERGLDLNWVVYGDLRMDAYAAPNGSKTTVTAHQHFYFERGPNCVAGMASDGPVTEQSCVWLTVTYANPAAIVSDVPVPEKTKV